MRVLDCRAAGVLQHSERWTAQRTQTSFTRGLPWRRRALWGAPCDQCLAHLGGMRRPFVGHWKECPSSAAPVVSQPTRSLMQTGPLGMGPSCITPPAQRCRFQSKSVPFEFDFVHLGLKSNRSGTLPLLLTFFSQEGVCRGSWSLLLEGRPHPCSLPLRA